MADPDDLVTVGSIVKPHGIRGEVVVAPLTDLTEERFAPGEHVRAGRRRLVVEASRPHQGRLLVAFEGIADRTDAERLRGLELTAERRDPQESDVYLASELTGMEVRSEHDDVLGTVQALIELPESAGYDLLEIVREDGTTWLLPAVDEYMTVEQGDGGEYLKLSNPPAGLVDDEG